MYQTVLIPYDGTDAARRGAEHGIELAAEVGADVHALYVIDLPGAPRALSLRDDEEEMREEYRTYGEDVTAEICEFATDLGVECTTAIKSGSPSEEIVDYADDEGMDAIVIGSAYRGRFGSLLGSTSEKVVRTATVPVLSIRMQAND